MARVVVIRNPRSGRSRLAKSWPKIQSRIEAHFDSVHILETQRSGHATDLARQAIDQGASILVAVGGDGTVTQVANGMIGSHATLGIIPSGTGNDLCRTLGINASVERALSAITGGNTIEMDVGKWTTDRASGYFLNIAGMGFDAAVADRINRGFKSLRGTMAYLAAVVSTLSSYRASEVRITIDGTVMDETIMLAAIANAQCYGGGMRVAPMASVTDGVLEIVLVKEIGKLEFLRAFPSVFKGSHLGHPAVDCLRGREIRLEPRLDSPFLIDGELTPCKWAEIQVVPQQLRVLVPPSV